jgi:ribosomal-protein-alanine N-acetyltransferase
MNPVGIPRTGTEQVSELLSITLGVDQLGQLEALEQQGFGPRECWSMNSWRAELERPGQSALGMCASANGEGAVLVAAVIAGVQAPDAELLRIVVADDHRRRGLASHLLAASVGWAAEQGAERMLLEVRADNLAANALYERAGFHRLSERRGYYGRGVDALVLECMLHPHNGEDS